MIEVLERDGNNRLIKRDGGFFIQKRKWFKWRDVKYGPFGIDEVCGIAEFNIEFIARIKYYNSGPTSKD